jgi:hypothetical protein
VETGVAIVTHQYDWVTLCDPKLRGVRLGISHIAVTGTVRPASHPEYEDFAPPVRREDGI